MPKRRAPGIDAPDSAAPEKPAERPGTLPLTPEQRDRLAATLTASIKYHREILRPLHAKIKLWRMLYDSALRPDPDSKPWTDSSEIFFPIPQLVADAATSKILQTIEQQRDIVVAESTMQDTDYSALAGGASLDEDISAFRRAANAILYDEREVDIRSSLDAIVGEFCQIGTAVARITHELDIAPKKRRLISDPQRGTIVEIAENVPLRDRVCIRAIPLEALIWDTTARSTPEIRFLAYPYTADALEIQRAAKREGWYDEALADCLASPDNTPDPQQSDEARQSRLKPSAGPAEERINSKGERVSVAVGARYTIWEAHFLNLDPNEDGVLEDVLIRWHEPTNRILVCRLFDYIHNELPFEFAWYRVRRDRPIGVGTIEPGETLAVGANAISNQAIDAQTIRNCPTIIVTEQDQEVRDELESRGWHPGQILTERAKDSIRTLEFGATGNTTVSMGIFHDILEAYFRVNHLGPSQFGSVESAQRVAGDLGASIMSEGLALHDKVLSRFRSSLASICRKTLATSWQVRPQSWLRALGPDDFSKASRLVSILGWDRIALSINISSATHSRELDRQNAAALGQFLGAWEQSVVSAIQLGSPGTDPKTGQPTGANPLMQRALMMLLKAKQDYMRYFLDKFPNITDPEKYIPDIHGEIMKMLGAAGGASNGMGGGAGPLPGESLTPFIAIPPASPGPGAGSILGGQ